MNRPIRKVGIAIAVLFLAMFVNLNVVQVLHGSSYRDDPQNRRVLLNEYSNPRGQIVVSGTNVAESRETKDELKYLRVYPQGPAFAPATGYYSFTYGSSAVEYAENSVLSGDDPRLFTARLGNILTGRDPRGGSVQLTLSKAAQEAAYSAMRVKGTTFKRGAVVALDPTTGAILALVSTPSYDPNRLASHSSSGIAHAYACYNQLLTLRRGLHESASAYRIRTARSTAAELILRTGGSKAYLADVRADRAKYPSAGLVYSSAGNGTTSGQAEQVQDEPYLEQFPYFGATGCGDVPDDPTALYRTHPADNGPLFDRALSQVYPPGSIFKIIDSAAALRLGVTSTSKVAAPRYYWPLDPKRTSACPSDLAAACVENFAGETCEGATTATLAYALAKSCNTAFASLAVNRIGAQDLARQAGLFGLDGAQLSVPMDVAPSTIGSLNELSTDDAALAQTSFGQRDARVSPLQAAMMSAAVANFGRLMTPYLVRSELRPNLSPLHTTQPSQLSQVLDPNLDQDLIKMMEGVVTSPEGTGGPARIRSLEPAVVVGGKTGTADVGATSASKVAPDAWFTGFAMVKGAPKIAVAVLIENGGVQGNEATGGLAAGPVARKVMQAYLKSIGVS